MGRLRDPGGQPNDDVDLDVDDGDDGDGERCARLRLPRGTAGASAAGVSAAAAAPGVGAAAGGGCGRPSANAPPAEEEARHQLRQPPLPLPQQAREQRAPRGLPGEPGPDGARGPRRPAADRTLCPRHDPSSQGRGEPASTCMTPRPPADPRPRGGAAEGCPRLSLPRLAGRASAPRASRRGRPPRPLEARPRVCGPVGRTPGPSRAPLQGARAAGS
jgi:hypothetical protein